jgi:RimJ/RimL family protein N-acetyltransferase
VAHEDFIARHFPALERESARHNLLLGLIEDEREVDEPRLQTFTLGGPGACAIYAPGRNLVLGELDEREVRRLAELCARLRPEGVLGPGLTAAWYVAHASALSQRFEPAVPQLILSLASAPVHPPVAGRARIAGPEDAALVADWILAFHDEAVPQEPRPDRERLLGAAARGRHFLWTLKGRPVALARIARWTRLCGAIGPVYTPPALRNRGYAAAITAHVAERVLAEGRSCAALYTLRQNPASNRCYAKVGFRKVCDSLHYRRVMDEAAADVPAA